MHYSGLVFVAVAIGGCGAVLGTPEDAVVPPPRGEDAGASDARDGDGPADDASAAIDGGIDGANDGAIDGANDGGNDGASTNDGAPSDAGDAGPVTRFVFVTSATFAGGFGSRAQADAECTALAATSNDARIASSTFTAYLAAANGGLPNARIVDRLYVRMDGEPVFSPGPTQNAVPLHPILVDEKGNGHSTDAMKWVWTGLADATSGAARTCADWTSSGQTTFGGFGDLTSTTAWAKTGSATASCDTGHRLYCFED